jgi:hypothetical protein
MTVLIAGGTGMIGSHLANRLAADGSRVIILTRDTSRREPVHPSISFAAWDPNTQQVDEGAIASADHVVHLAGAGVADKRWSKKRKKEIVDSRVKSGELIIQALHKYPNQVKTLICGSAIGFYGPGDRDREFTEEDPAFDDFLAETCRAWESSVAPAESLGKRLVVFRTGIVLSSKGGALEEFRKPLRFGVVPVLGTGTQVISWIHVDDLVSMYQGAMENNKMEGVYNAVAPHPVSNREFMRTLKRVERRAGLVIEVPSVFLKLILGEMSIEVLKSAKVSADKIVSTGFTFRFPQIHEALQDLIRKGQR